MKKIRTIIGTSLTFITLVAAAALPAHATTETAYKSVTVTMEQAAGMYKTQGRTGLVGTGLSMDWSGAGIEFNADCEGTVALNLKVKAILKDAYFTAYVDGVRMERLMVETDTSDIEAVNLVIANNLKQGNHTFCFYNQTECTSVQVSIESIALTGKLITPPVNNDLFIEYVGDSYFSGYGNLVANDDTSTNLNDTPLISDGTQSLGVLTANILHADYSVLAVSGYGLVCGTYGKDSNMPKYYDYVSWERSHTDSVSDTWSFSRPADVVMIELGDNDSYFASTSGVTPSDFKAQAKSLIERTRSKNPKAKIVWMVYGSFGSQTKSVIDELGGMNAGIYMTTLDLGNGGVFGHPTAAQLHVAANKLAAYLQETVLPSNSTASTSKTGPSVSATLNSSSNAITGDSSQNRILFLIFLNIVAAVIAVLFYKKRRSTAR